MWASHNIDIALSYGYLYFTVMEGSMGYVFRIFKVPILWVIYLAEINADFWDGNLILDD